MTVAELREKMTWSEFLWWGEFFKMEEEDRKKNEKKPAPPVEKPRSFFKQRNG